MEMLNKSWKDLCMLLFGQDIGKYTDYSDWLKEMVDKPVIKNSNLSGKEIIYSTSDYSNIKNAISFDEIEPNKRFEPLSINEIKDIDSILEAIQDRMYYAGNMVLGNSKEIHQSSNIHDSFYVSNTTLSGNSKYMAFCTLARLDTVGFGGNAFSQCDYCLKCHELTRVKRSFELWMSQDCSDSYYSHGLKNCSNCFFSFNLENKRYAIGNLELSPDRYKEIKNKLVLELVTELKREKRLPSLVEIVEGVEITVPKIIPVNQKQKTLGNNNIDSKFAKTMELLLKKKPSKSIDSYAIWLARHVHGFKRHKSAASGKDVFLARYANYADLPKNRLLTIEEAKNLGQTLKLSLEDINSINFKNAGLKIGKIAFFNTDIQDGQNIDNVECSITIDAVNCYRSVCSVYSKYCAYSFWPRSSEHLFGCDSVFDSAFSINCYHSVNLQRCLELDSCNSCSDSYFSHNCENIKDSMFCFNTKNKKYAIGNFELERDQYVKVKEGILDQLYTELENNGTSKYDIFLLDNYK